MKKASFISNVWKYDGVWEFCIKYKLYTCGTNEAYRNMLKKCQGFQPVIHETVDAIANDIIEHSSTDLTFKDIVSGLYNECTFFDVEQY